MEIHNYTKFYVIKSIIFQTFQIDSNGNTFRIATSDDQNVTIRMRQPVSLKLFHSNNPEESN